MQIVLFEPEIPPNTGNIARLCAATNTELHLIKPLGFSLEDRYLKRAGLDYWENVQLRVWNNFVEYLQNAGQDKRIVATSARQGVYLHDFEFTAQDALLFGPETRGLPLEIMNTLEHHVRIPVWGKVRSLNLSTAAGIVLYQALYSAKLLPQL